VERARAYAVPGADDSAEVDIALDVRGRTTEAAVRAWCGERLSRYKQPTLIRLL